MSNKFTGAFREAVQIVYNGLGGHVAFLAWARENQTEYYRIASRLIPGEMQGDNGDKHITVIVQRGPETRTVLPAIEDHSQSTGEPS